MNVAKGCFCDVHWHITKGAFCDNCWWGQRRHSESSPNLQLILLINAKTKVLNISQIVRNKNIPTIKDLPFFSNNIQRDEFIASEQFRVIYIRIKGNSFLHRPKDSLHVIQERATIWKKTKIFNELFQLISTDCGFYTNCATIKIALHLSISNDKFKCKSTHYVRKMVYLHSAWI